MRSSIGNLFHFPPRRPSAGWLTLPLSLLAIFLSCHANRTADRALEINRIGTLPKPLFREAPAQGVTPETLIVATSGGPFGKLDSDRFVCLEVIQLLPDGRSLQLLYPIPAFYRDRVYDGFEESAGAAWTLRAGIGNTARIEPLKQKVAEAMDAAGLGHVTIEIRRYVRLRYRDAIGKRIEQTYGDEGRGLVPIQATRFDEIAQALEQRERAHRAIDLDHFDFDAVVEMIISECQANAGRPRG